MNETAEKPKKTNKSLIASIIVAIVVCICAGGWNAFIADDNNLLQGVDTEAEKQQLLAERRNELLIAFVLGGVPLGLGAGAIVFIGCRYLRKTS